MARKRKELNEERLVNDDQRNEMIIDGEALDPQPGRWYIFATDGPIMVGFLKAMCAEYFHIDQASWVIDAGRKSTFVADPQSCIEADYVGYYSHKRDAVTELIRYRKNPRAIKTKPE